MRDSRYLRQTQWTDLCLAVGPNLRWAEEDYDDLSEAHPDVFLGMRVKITTSEQVYRAVRGQYQSKVVIFDGPHSRIGNRELADVLGAARFYSWPTKFEHWHVHRGRGIWRIA